MIPDLGSKGCAPWQVQDSVLASQGQSPCRVWDGVPTGIKNTAEGFLRCFLLVAIQLGTEHVCDLIDRDISAGVLFVDDGFHFVDLEAVDDDAHDGLFGAGIPAFGIHHGDAATEDLGKSGANVLGVGGDDISGFRTVETIHDEVNGLESDKIGDDGVEREHPALENDAADDVEDDVICHHEGADGEPHFFGEDDGHDLDAVHRAAEADRKAAARTRDKPTEECAKEKVGACKGGGDADVDGQDIGDEPSGKGIDRDGIDRVDREDLTLAFQAVKKERNVKKEKKDGERKGRDHGKKHGCARDAAVI